MSKKTTTNGNLAVEEEKTVNEEAVKPAEVVPEKEEITVFGKIDRKIVDRRNAKAAKKAEKEQKKAEKAKEKENSETKEKKFPWTAVAIGVTALLSAGGALLVKSEIDERNQETDAVLPRTEPASLPSVATESAVETPVASAEVNPEYCFMTG